MNDRAAFRDARDLLLEHATNYHEACARFRWPSLTHFNWALDHFDQLPEGDLALIVRSDTSKARRSFTFGQLRTSSNQVANLFRQAGVARGDRLLLMLGNTPELWLVFLACMKLGVVIVPSTTALSRSELDDRLVRGGVKHVVAEAGSLSKLGELDGLTTRWVVGENSQPGWRSLEEATAFPSDFEPSGETLASDTLLLYFTSGTTAKPKLVRHTHASYPVGHLSTMYWIGLRPRDLHWNISSPGWAKHAWSNIFAPWNAGACVFVHATARFSARTTLDLLEEEAVTTLCAPPTVWRMLVLEDLRQRTISLRECVAAGEPLNPEIISTIEQAWNITVRDGFGQTETTALVGNSPGQPVKPGSMGRPLPGYRIVLQNDLIDTGDEPHEGELAVDLAAPRPTGVMAGYADDAALWSEASRGDRYRTGDIVSRDAEGYITYVGRADDVFKASDYRISPFELESVLLEHPSVAEAAVVPSPDSLRLAVPKAFVVLRPEVPHSAELGRELLAFVRERVAPFKRIRRLEFAMQAGAPLDAGLTVLPKTISGKIRRVELRVLETGRNLAAGPNANEVWDHG